MLQLNRSCARLQHAFLDTSFSPVHRARQQSLWVGTLAGDRAGGSGTTAPELSGDGALGRQGAQAGHRARLTGEQL